MLSKDIWPVAQFSRLSFDTTCLYVFAENMLISNVKKVSFFFTLYIHLPYKSGLISSLLYKAFTLCSNFEIFHQEIIFLEDLFKRNDYPSNFIDKCVKTFLDKIFIVKKVFLVSTKEGISLCLTFYW